MREKEDDNTIRCPRCGLSEERLRLDRIVTCPLCYSIFSHIITKLLSDCNISVYERSEREVDELLH